MLLYMNEELAAAVAKLFCGLQVPISLGMPLGVAREGWDEVRKLLPNELAFGWVQEKDVAKWLASQL